MVSSRSIWARLAIGEIRDRSFEQQRYRASGLTLVTAAIALWNTVYVEQSKPRSETATP